MSSLSVYLSPFLRIALPYIQIRAVCYVLRRCICNSCARGRPASFTYRDLVGLTISPTPSLLAMKNLRKIVIVNCSGVYILEISVREDRAVSISPHCQYI